MANEANDYTEEERHALGELQYAADRYRANPCAGTLYALSMAIAECDLLGLYPEGSSIKKPGNAPGR